MKYIIAVIVGALLIAAPACQISKSAQDELDKNDQERAELLKQQEELQEGLEDLREMNAQLGAKIEAGQEVSEEIFEDLEEAIETAITGIAGAQDAIADLDQEDKEIVQQDRQDQALNWANMIGAVLGAGGGAGLISRLGKSRSHAEVQTLKAVLETVAASQSSAAESAQAASEKIAKLEGILEALQAGAAAQTET